MRSKVFTWASRRTASFGTALALVVIVAGTAAGTTGVMLHLNTANTGHATTTLSGNLTKVLQVTNTAGAGVANPIGVGVTSTNGTPLALQGSTSRPPMTVNSGVRVPNLNADKLDGVDSTGFIKGPGSATSKVFTVPAGAQASRYVGWTALAYDCPATPSADGTLRVYNFSGGDANVFVDTGDADPQHAVIETGYIFGSAAATETRAEYVSYAASSTGDAFTIQGNGPQGMGTLWVNTVHRGSDCYVQVQALFTR